MSEDAFTLTGAEVLLPGGTIARRSVRVDGATITSILPAEAVVTGRSIDASGFTLSPGFVDIHLNGGGGASFESADEGAFRRVIETGFQYGTTSVVGAINTATREGRITQLEALSQFSGRYASCLLGVHLEGPYYSPGQRGAHHSEWIRVPDPAEYGVWLDRFGDLIRVVTLAPELVGAMDLVHTLSGAGIVPSIGHTMATDEQVDEAIEAGARLVTHIYNAQSVYTRTNSSKHLGVAEMGLLRDELTVEIIPDNRHLTPRMQELIVKTKPHDRVCITTDAMEATGQGPGTYEAMGGVVWVDEEVAYREDRKRHAGSILTMDRGVRNIVRAGAGVASALRMATEVPARTIGAGDRKGILAEGVDADLVLLNDKLEVVTTMSRGEVVYAAEASPIPGGAQSP